MKKLFEILASTYALYLKTQAYHWNVVGPQFYSLHKLFEAQYTEMQSAVDELAELIRTKGEKVDASFENFNKTSKISPININFNAEQMVKDLALSHQKVCEMLESEIKSSSDVTVQDLLTGRLENHQKAIWFLNSIGAGNNFFAEQKKK